MPKTTTLKRGFTIVELLIVIVVIAILASILIVSYNGITQNANNTARISSARSILHSISIYETKYGSKALHSMLLAEESYSPQCIGTDYKDVSPGPEHSCRYQVTNGVSYTTPVNQPLYEALQSVAQYSMDYKPVTQKNIGNVELVESSSPYIQYVVVGTSGTNYSLNGGQSKNELILLSYRLEGENQDCKLSVVKLDSQAGGLHNYVTGSKNSTVLGGATECWVWLDW